MFILEDGEVFGDQSECHDACGEDADGDGNFGEGGEVIHVAHEGGKIEERVGMFDREPTDIEAVEDHADEDDDRADEQTIGTGAILFDGEPHDGSDHADENLSPEKYAHDSAGEKQTKFACHCEFTEFEQGINAERDWQTFGKFFEKMRFETALKIARTERRLENDHCHADSDGRREEHDRQDGRPPERVQFGRLNEKKRAEGRLMQGGKHHTEDHKGHDELVNEMRDMMQLWEFFQHHRRELDGKHGEVTHHADADLEQDTGVIPVDHHVPDAQGLTEVNEQSDGNHDVAEEGGENGRAQERLKFFDAQNVHRASHEETAAGDNHAREQVEADPEAPGVGIAQVTYRADAEGIASHCADEGNAYKREQYRRQYANAKEFWKCEIQFHLDSSAFSLAGFPFFLS